MFGPDAPKAAGSVQEPHDLLSDTQRESLVSGPVSGPASGVTSPRSRAIQYFHQLLHMRRQRDKRFGQDFTTDRGWDLLLLLMIARLEDRTTIVADVSKRANPHRVSIEELDRQIRLGNVILMDVGDDLDRSLILLADEAARHMIDLFRIDTAPGGAR